MLHLWNERTLIDAYSIWRSVKKEEETDLEIRSTIITRIEKECTSELLKTTYYSSCKDAEEENVYFDELQ